MMIKLDANETVNAAEIDRVLQQARVALDKNPTGWRALGLVLIRQNEKKPDPDIEIRFRTDGFYTTTVLLLGALDVLKDHVISGMRGLYK